MATPPKWLRDEAGRLKCATKPSMLRRLNGWDYKGRGIYQITITLADRASQALGRVVVSDGRGGWVDLATAKGLGLTPDDVVARVELSAVGEIVLACWREIAAQWPGVTPLEAAIMPDHFHGLIYVETPQQKPLGSIVGSFKAKSSSRAKSLGASAQAQNHAGTPAQGLASAQAQNRSASGAQGCTGAFCAQPPAAGLWSPGYQDTVLLHEGQLANMFDYLRDNARRRAIKALFPELFKIVGELKVALKGLAPAAPETRAYGFFSALGNRFLLGRPLAQVQCSRDFFRYRRIPKPGGWYKIARDAQGEPIVEKTTSQFEEKRRLLLAAAKKGQVLISPCVSDGERQIARAALAAGLPLITLQNKGFAKLQKPSGRYFEACSAGRLLMLAPAAWPYRPGEKPMTRFDATAMNRLCQWLAGEDAVEINYHGMKPADIDGLAKTAARVKEERA